MFNRKKNKYREKINEFNNKLHENSRNKNVQGCLNLALRDRMEFLVDINKLNSDEINLENIDEFMKLFGNKNEQQILENQKNQLENQLKILNEKNDVENSIRINDEISEIGEKLDYCARISEISKELNFNDLIILLGEKLLMKKSFLFHKKQLIKL
ncbi:unnamed protein product [Didymodactylos carnosus]|uniref:Uncharacterized protein n=1 Tax=Didymodactylos carnosus TaxID=1234261 RepID=A0A8S2YX01_9BILA|nr:unnamed protein product [Didymodactylos carnosus]